MSEYNKCTESFVDWLENKANVSLSPGVSIEDYRKHNQGRALVATADIEESAVLFKVPRQSVLSVEFGAIAKISDKVSQELQHAVGHWEGLIISILYEVKVLGEKSFWYEYFQALPDRENDENAFDNLFYWNDQQLELLKPSLIIERIGKTQARKMFEQCSKLIGDLDLKFEITWDEFLYAASLIMSYSFDVERPDYNGDPEGQEGIEYVYENGNDNDDEDDDQLSKTDPHKDGYFKSMVPLADMLNADTNLVNANLTYSETHLVMVATKKILKGEQVYNTYGEHPNSELLRKYGFVEWGGSKYDFAEVTMASVFQVLSKEFGTTVEIVANLVESMNESETIVSDIWEDEEIIMESYDCYTNGSIMDELIYLVQVVCLMLELKITIETPNFGKMLKKILKLVNKKRITAKCQKALQKLLQSRLAAYPEGIASKEFPQPGAEYYQSMAERVLCSEASSLETCIKSLDTEYQTMSNDEYIPEMTQSSAANKRARPASQSNKNKKNKR